MWFLENCIVRRASSTDLGRIEEFLKGLTELEKAYFSEEMLDLFFSDSDTLIAEINDEIVGIAVIKYSKEKGKKHIAHLLITVKEELRGKGIGYNLSKVAEEIAIEKGISKFKIETPTFNIYTISRAEIWGYRREAYLAKEFYLGGKYYDLVVLSKMLQKESRVNFNYFQYD
ncbi:MAG: GNAT family N-acetyltransferase [Archaeoglobaceae archaeon]